MRKIENELDELVYEQYGDELDAKDKQLEESAKIIKSKDNQLKSYQKLIKKLDDIDDLTPEARNIINSLMLLK